MPRFLVTADWQLGMTRAFLDPDAQARYSDARAEAISRIAEVARDESCAFVVVAGDVFDANQVDARTVERVLDRLRAFTVPTFLLPGNHDPLDPSTIYAEARLAGRLPANVRIVRDTTPIQVAPGIEIVGAPWRTKNPSREPTMEALAALTPAPRGVTRVFVGHGAVDACIDVGQATRPPTPLASIEAALSDGCIHFAALGDRHSKTRVGETGRVWYPGTPEQTRFDEREPGYVLVVDLESDRCEARGVAVGRWKFVERDVPLHGTADVDELCSWIDGLGTVDRVVLRLALVGDLPVVERGRLEAVIAQRSPAFAGLEVDDARLRTSMTQADVDALELSGLALQAAEALRERIAAGGDDGVVAQDALLLLARIVKEDA